VQILVEFVLKVINSFNEDQFVKQSYKKREGIIPQTNSRSLAKGKSTKILIKCYGFKCKCKAKTLRKKMPIWKDKIV